MVTCNNVYKRTDEQIFTAKQQPYFLKCKSEKISNRTSLTAVLIFFKKNTDHHYSDYWLVL